MLYSAKGSEKNWCSRPLSIALHPGEWLIKLILFVLIVFGFLLISRPAAAIFVSSSEKEQPPRQDAASPVPKAAQPTQSTPSGKVPTPTPAETGTGPHEISSSPDLTPRKAMELRSQIQDTHSFSPRKRKVNSNTFARMSGETRAFKPVAVPTARSKVEEASSERAERYVDPQEKILSIGSWIFILVCVGTVAIFILRIKKLSALS